jgi:hypothetical protein
MIYWLDFYFLSIFMNMETKTCTTCNEEKFITEFYQQKDRKSGSSSCKKCFNDYCVQRWVQKKKEAIEYKGGKCEDCPASYPREPYVIFDFHHLDPEEKDVDWGKLRLKSWDKIKLELDKCALLCSNCHRKRHHNE